MKKGYCTHMIEQQGILSKKHIQHFIRNGQKYITKNLRDDMENSIDPAERCYRHDRHKQLPGERIGIPKTQMPDVYKFGTKSHLLSDYSA